MRIAIVALLPLAVSAFAQGPVSTGPGPGRRGFDDAQGPGGHAGPGARFLGAEAGMPGRVVKNAPYSGDVITESTHTLADGNHIRQSSASRFYRDGEGRTRREQSVNLSGLGTTGLRPGSLSSSAQGVQATGMPQLVFINDPVAGVNYALNTRDRTGTKSSWTARGAGGPHPQFAGRGPRPRPGDAAAAAPGAGAHGMAARAGAQNIKTESLGRQTIEGVPAEGTRTTMTIPAGQMGNEQPIQIVTETWYSADLQTMVLSKHSDPRNGETVTRLMNVSRTEPSRLLFEAPADFKVTETERGMMRPHQGGPAQAK